MNIRLLLLLIFALAGITQVQGELKPFYGPILESYDIDESTTLREAIDDIRQAALKQDRFFALKVQLSETHLKMTALSRMTLRKVPTAVALQYVQTIYASTFGLSFKDGLWTIQLNNGETVPDIIQISLKNVTLNELSALGIVRTEKGFFTDDQKKWPSGEHESAAIFDGTLIVRACRSELDNLEMLLKLHRAGYQVPKINSRKK